MADIKTVEVAARDLPLHCPSDDTPIWNRHPRVFLDVRRTGEALCPYCRTHYVLRDEASKGH
jgi:uncharacterized Zn-finger protein